MPVETCSKEVVEGGQGSPIRIPPSVPSFRVVLCTGTAVCCGGTRAGKSECGRSSEVSAMAGFGELRRTRVPWGGAKSGLKRGLSSVKYGARSHGTRHEQADRLGPRPTEPCAEPFSRFVPRAMDPNRMVSGQGRMYVCIYIYKVDRCPIVTTAQRRGFARVEGHDGDRILVQIAVGVETRAALHARAVSLHRLLRHRSKPRSHKPIVRP